MVDKGSGKRNKESEDLYRDYISRLEAGENVTPEEYLSRYPLIEDELRDLFGRLKGIGFGKNEVATKEIDSGKKEEVPKALGDFRIIRELGSGGMGTVYEAEQVSLKRRVALKVLPPHLSFHGEAVLKFKREAEAGGRQTHPGIVAVHAIGQEGGTHYIAQELVEGGYTLEDRIRELREESKRPPGYFREIAKLVAEIAEALQHAHDSGVVHRDIKPSNILLSSGDRPKVTDFGLAKVEDALALSRSGELAGTPFYMSPEQAASQRIGIDHRTDIFSLGVTLYELLTLELPFSGDSQQEILKKILLNDPRPPRAASDRVPRDLEVICLKAMEKSPDARYCTMADFAEDLLRFHSGDVINAKPVWSFVRFCRRIRRNPALLMATAAFFVAFIALLVLAGYMAKVQWDETERRRDLERQVEEVIGFAQSAIDAHALEDAEAHFGRLLSLDDSHPEVDRLRREIAMLSCFRELELARRLREDYKTLSTEWTDLDRELSALQRKIDSGFTREKERIKAQDLRHRLKSLELQLADSKESIIYAINTALALSQAAGEYECPPVFAAFAAHYMDRWEEEFEGGNTFGMDHYAALVRSYDTNGRYADTLDGLATLAIAGTEGARAYLFRYHSHVEVSPNAGVDRLVPVPRIGEVEDAPFPIAGGAYAGDRCIAVHSGGLTSLERGDLIVSIDGQLAGGGLFVAGVADGSSAARSKVEPFQRISSVDTLERLSAFTWDRYRSDTPAWIEVASQDGKIAVPANGPGESLTERSGIQVLPDDEILAEVPAPRDIEIVAVRDGKEIKEVVKEGEVAGIYGEVTAFPLHCTEKNLLGTLPIGSTECAPGSCLVLVRKEGMEDLRLPLFLDRRKAIHLQAELLPEGFSPPGFVRVAGGHFFSGGDSEALWPEDRTWRDVEEFWIARRETTLGEWLEFVAESRSTRPILDPHVYIPRLALPPGEAGAGPADIRYLAVRDRETGRFMSRFWRDLDTPVVGVSRQDVIDFIEWKNRDAGEWIFALPTQIAWEKAARGADQRPFPWGKRFDFSFCKSFFSHPEEAAVENDLRRLEPGMSFPVDESPYGVRDLAGSVIEWNNDRTSFEYPIYSIRGGAYDGARASLFRVASRDGLRADTTSHNLGFRLVAVRR